MNGDEELVRGPLSFDPDVDQMIPLDQILRFFEPLALVSGEQLDERIPPNGGLVRMFTTVRSKPVLLFYVEASGVRTLLDELRKQALQ